MSKEMNDQSIPMDPISMNPALQGATLLFQMGPGVIFPWEYGGVKHEILGYRESAWIGITQMMSPIYDIAGPDACEFLQSVCE